MPDAPTTRSWTGRRPAARAVRSVVVDRPAPGALGERRDPAAWRAATSGSSATAAGWDRPRRRPGRSSRRADPGAAADRRRPGRRSSRSTRPCSGRGCAGHAATAATVLHLFAYTGSRRSRWRAAGAASPTSTRRGRPSPGRAATPSCPAWPTAPIRWIVDDARRSSGARRAAAAGTTGSCSTRRRYGHGAGGPWQLDDDLPALLDAAAAVASRTAFVLLTAHTPGFDGERPRRRSSGTRLGVAAPRSASAPRAARRRRDARARRLRALGRRGMMAADDRPPPRPITSPTNPRVKAAVAAARPARARRDGPDARRRRARGPPGARRAARRRSRRSSCAAAARRPGRPRGARSRCGDAAPRVIAVSAAVLASSRSATARTGSSRSSRIPDRRLDAPRASRRTRSSSSLEGVEKPGNLGAVLRSADAAGADAVIAADRRGPTCSTRTRSGRRSGTIFARARRGGAVARRRAPGSRAAGIRVVAARVDARAPVHRRRPARAASRSSSAARRTASRTPGGRRRRAGLAPDARRRRQPQRLDRRGRPALRGAPPARTAALTRGTTDARWTTVRLRDHRRRPGRRGRRVRGARAAARPSRSSTGAGSAGSCPHIGCVPSKSLLHGGRRATREPGDYAWARASARRDYMVNRPAGAAEPDDSSHVSALEDAGAVVLPRRRRGSSAAAASRSATTTRPTSSRPRTSWSPSARPRRCRRSTGSTTSEPGRTARRRSPASCREPRSSSAAARPAASSPRSTRGSASR